MHPLTGYQKASDEASLVDYWSPSVADLNALASMVLGFRGDGWVRRNRNTAEIGIRRELGAQAEMLPKEMATLATLTASILTNETASSSIEAAAFFHLRFEAIHPLRDGNGRVGRIILAAQCASIASISRSQFLNELHSYENDYKWVFASGNEKFHFELLVDLLCRLLGVSQYGFAVKLPFSLRPEFPCKIVLPSVHSGTKTRKQTSAFWRNRK